MSSTRSARWNAVAKQKSGQIENMWNAMKICKVSYLVETKTSSCPDTTMKVKRQHEAMPCKRYLKHITLCNECPLDPKWFEHMYNEVPTY